MDKGKSKAFAVEKPENFTFSEENSGRSQFDEDFPIIDDQPQNTSKISQSKSPILQKIFRGDFSKSLESSPSVLNTYF
jgi:hypothetical protein